MPRGYRLEDIATGVLALCAVAVTLMVGRRELAPPHAASPTKPVEIKAWQRYARGSKWLSPGDGAPAPVTIVEFSDFQCPFCGRMAQTLHRLQERHGARLAIAYRHYPISRIHPFARPAAIAAECAAAQRRFAEYHDYLFAHQDSLGTVSWAAIAAQVSVPDTARFAQCLNDIAPAAAVRADSLAGEDLRITGTPTLLVNGKLLPSGVPAEEELDALIRDQLAAAPLRRFHSRENARPE